MNNPRKKQIIRDQVLLDNHFSDYPDNTTLEEVCELYLQEDESVSIWERLEDWEPSQLVEHLMDINDSFNSYLLEYTKEMFMGGELASLESIKHMLENNPDMTFDEFKKFLDFAIYQSKEKNSLC